MYGHRLATAIVLATALLAPAAVRAADSTVQIRLFDRTHKDYHVWDSREDQMYRQRLTDQHRKYKTFARQSHKNQDAYWGWRHTQDGR